MAARVFEWLRALARRGATVLLGDPGRNYLPKSHLEELAVYDVQTTRELEDREVRRTKVWRVVA
jgi:predicted nicotinamide N-methyase